MTILALKVSGLLLTLISIITLIVSVATNQWFIAPTFYFGLWITCSSLYSYCATLSSISAYLNVTRSFLIIAIIFLVMAVIMQIAAIKSPHFPWNLNKQKQAGTWSLNAGLFTVIGMTVFTATSGLDPRTDHYSWSYALGWVSAVLSLAAGIIGYYVFKKEIPGFIEQPPVIGQVNLTMAYPYAGQPGAFQPNPVQPGAFQHNPVQPGVFQHFPGSPTPFQPCPGPPEGFVPHPDPPPDYAPHPGLTMPNPQCPVQEAILPQPEKRF